MRNGGGNTRPTRPVAATGSLYTNPGSVVEPRRLHRSRNAGPLAGAAVQIPGITG
jgi:hypothetical protein